MAEALKDRDEQKGAQAFLTTSDVMNSLNKALSDLSGGDEIAKPHFELQRRLPDGSTRRATPDEQAANDCQTQMQQAAQLLSELKTEKERLEWAEAQRLFGNQVYQKKMYKEAIDVYLTCLPAVAQEEKITMDTETQGSIKRQRLLLFMKVMNNLSQSTLQLGWYKKTEHFGILAFEHLEKQIAIAEEMDSEMAAELKEQQSKLYFRRGKARRLRGEYSEARRDFEQALKSIEIGEAADEKRKNQQSAIQKELSLLKKSEAEGRRNQERQKRALQRVMMTKSDTNTSRALSNEKKSSSPVASVQTAAIFPTDGNLRHRRPYSTLRAPSAQRSRQRPIAHRHVAPTGLSPWQHYMVVAGRVAERLLDVLGEDESESEQTRNRFHPKSD